MAKSKLRARRRARAAARRRQTILRGGVIGVVVLAAAGAWFFTRTPAAPPVAPERAALEHSRGPEDAPVTILEFGDFNCPSCQAYHQAGILDRVLEAYPTEVRVVYRHFPVITPESPRLAEAAECAADQGAFWDFHDLLFLEGPTRASQMTGFAASLGLDASQFEACFEGRAYANLVQVQTGEAFSLGLRGTPSFQVNDTLLAGPPNYDQLVRIIDSILAASG